eukprot:30997-Pelagococcus_subviridis.AAC.3
MPRTDAQRIDIRRGAVDAQPVRPERVQVTPRLEVLFDPFRRGRRLHPLLQRLVDLAQNFLASRALLRGFEHVLEVQPRLELRAELHVHRRRRSLAQGFVQGRHRARVARERVARVAGRRREGRDPIDPSLAPSEEAPPIDRSIGSRGRRAGGSRARASVAGSNACAVLAPTTTTTTTTSSRGGCACGRRPSRGGGVRGRAVAAAASIESRQAMSARERR